MQYTKIKASYFGDKSRLNRTFLVKPDIDLETLGCVFCTGFHAAYEHAFMFRAHKISFVPDSWADDSYFDDVSMRGKTLSDLGPSFRFIYDTGDNWEFECKVYKRPVMYDSEEIAVIIDGAGAGIWEDNAWGLYRYLNGEIPPDTSEDLEDMEWYMPWNLSLDQVSDFDEFDLENEQDQFSMRLPADIGMYRMSISADPDSYDGVPVDSIWYTFQSYVNESSGSNTPEQIRRIFDEFKRVCGVLKENEALPEQFQDLKQTGADLHDLNYLVYEMPFWLSKADKEEETVLFLKELKGMFIFEKDAYEEIADWLSASYIRLRDYKEAQEELDEWHGKYPDSFIMYSRQIDLYGQSRKFKDAEALLNKLDITHMEIDQDNYRLFVAAAEFYRIKGNKKKANHLEEQIANHHEAMIEDIDDLDDDDDDFYDYDDDDDDFDEEAFFNRSMTDMMRQLIINDADKSFYENLEKYENGDTGETEQLLLKAVTRSFLMDRQYWIDPKKNGAPKTRRIDGSTYIVLYTDQEAAKKDGVRKPAMTSSSEMMKLTDRVQKCSGFVIDPGPGGDGFAIEETVLMEELQDLMKTLLFQILKEQNFE